MVAPNLKPVTLAVGDHEDRARRWKILRTLEERDAWLQDSPSLTANADAFHKRFWWHIALVVRRGIAEHQPHEGHIAGEAVARD